LEEGARLIGTTLPEHCQVFCCPELARRIQIIALPELSSDSLARILLNARSRYPVEIHEGAALACIRAARDLPGHFPGNALSLLDAAASLAVASGGELVAADDIYSTAHRFPPLAELQNDE
jgi:hypothetical protein